jgi:putative peptide zinc metalloprotease protein
VALVTVVAMNIDAIFSQQWHRVRGIKPRWKTNVQFSRQTQRDTVWHLVSGSGTQQTLRLNALAWAVLGRCNGQLTLDQVWREVLAQLGPNTPTQDETIELINQASDAGLLECDRLADFSLLQETERSKISKEKSARWSPISLRLELGDPTRLLNAMQPIGKGLFSEAGAFAWLVLMALAALTVIDQLSALQKSIELAARNPSAWVYAWFLFLPIKLIHELGHGLAAQKFGVTVNKVGISWMLIFPAPFVDASGANALSRRSQRAMISAAGIAVELALAALALYLWTYSEPGVIKDIALSAMMTAGISTLIFNANPLMKMDGYYVLCDCLSLQNLAPRSTQFWQNQWHRLAGITPSKTIKPSRGERVWLWLYSPLSWLYRINIYLWSFFWLGAMHRWLAAGLLASAAFTLLLKPAYSVILKPLQAAGFASFRPSKFLRAMSVLALPALLIAVVPLPDREIVQGLVWHPETQHVRAHSAGQLQILEQADNHHLIARVIDPQLETERQRAQSQLDSINTQYQAELGRDLVKAQWFSQEQARIQASLDHIAQRVAEQSIAVPSDGAMQWLQAPDQNGKWVQPGELLGFVQNKQPHSVQVGLSQETASRISQSIVKVSVGNPDQGGPHTQMATLRQLPTALSQLPSSAMAQINGGPITTDPSDPKHLKPLYPTFGLELMLAQQIQAPHASSVWVVFDYGHAPMAVQWWTQIKQQLRSRMAVAPV